MTRIDVWSGYAKDSAYGSWRYIDINRDDWVGGVIVWEESDLRDDIVTMEDLLSAYADFADDVVPMGRMKKEFLQKLYEDAKE